ncbi:MAG: phosphatase [Oscillospiraceae bacterium]|nr:phosphatase [Oscillospiraceae bacterium]
MINIVGDTHTHTVACDHAHSTLLENARQANKLGHAFLCLTEHAPAMPGGASRLHFGTIVGNLPRVIEGVTIIKGVELNILDYAGTVDLPEQMIAGLEWVIASYHPPCLEASTTAAHTRGWIKIAENPHIDVIGHCGRDWFEFEHRPALEAFKAYGKIVEINTHSLNFGGRCRQNCLKIAGLCAELEIPVVLGSDAHFCDLVGNVTGAAAMLEEIGFPKELVLNGDHDRFLQTVRRTGGRDI